MDINAVLSDVRNLVDDPGQRGIGKQDYLLPKVSIAYRDVWNDLLANEVPIDEADVLIPNVPAGTHDLSAYQASGKPLELMSIPLSMHWKEAGSPEDQYLQVRKGDKVRDLQPDTVVRDWAFIGGTIEITVVTIAVDLRIRCEMLQADITDPNTTIALAYLRNALAYRTAYLVATIRNNPGWKKDYPVLYQQNIDNVVSNLARSQQDVVRRFGRMSRRRTPYGMPKLRSS